MEKLIVKNSVGNDIHVYLYDGATAPVKGVVHLIHGVSEHIARYGLFAEFLNRNGYVAVGCDFLGHGLSTDTNAYVHYADRDGDRIAYESITLVQDFIKQRYPDLPVFVLGHSMGSFLARLALLRKPDFYKKAVLTGTAMMPLGLIRFGILLSTVIKALRGPKYVSPLLQKMGIDAYPAKMRKDGIIGDRDVEWLSKDVEIQNYYEKSPMCGQPATVSANKDLFKWLVVINDPKQIATGRKDTPLLFASGKNDPLSEYGKTVLELAAVYRKLGYVDVTDKLYEDDRHEILNELDKETVYRDILTFLEK
ncbi:MAG: alpha/beta hydrolase [Candidatus Izemoplasmatales bacterium]